MERGKHNETGIRKFLFCNGELIYYKDRREKNVRCVYNVLIFTLHLHKKNNFIPV